MKRLIFISLYFVSISSNCQTVKPVDFLNHGIDIKETYPTYSTVKVRIDNINRFVYKVAVEKTDTDFNVTVPAILSAIKMPAFFSTETIAPATAPSLKSLDLTKTPRELSDQINDNIKQIIFVRERMNKAILMHNEVLNISKDCEHDFATIEASVIAKVQGYQGNAAATIIALAPLVKQDLFDNIKIANDSYAQVEKLLVEWQGKTLVQFRKDQSDLNNTLRVFKNDLLDLQSALKVATTPSKKDDITIKIRKKEADIAAIETQLANGKEDFPAKKKELEDKITNAKALLAEINKFNEEGKVFTLADDILKINPSNYSYYSETVKLKKDEVKFQFTVNAEGQLTCNKPNEDKFDVILRSRGGVKLDFSTGLFANFGSKDFLGHDYYYRPLSDTTTMISVHEDGRKALFGIGALMHIYMRSPACFKVGLAIGASTTTNFDIVNLHAGISFIIGDKERFCITPGITVREAKLIDKDYTLNTLYDTRKVPEEVPTIKKFPVTGFFVAFTYNISRFNK